MASTSSTRRDALRACALVAAISAGPAACILDVQGKTTGGAGGSATTSTTTSTTGSGTSSGSGTGGAMEGCTPGALKQCYDGPDMTEGVGICKQGASACLADGKTQGPCDAVKPKFDDCFTTEDEDCDGKTPPCAGGTLNAAAPGVDTGDDSVFDVATDSADNIYAGGVTDGNGKGSYYLSLGTARLIKVDKAGAPLLDLKYPTTGGSGLSVIRGVTVDAKGRTVVVGSYSGKISAHGVDLSSKSNSVDVFVFVLGSDGTPIWYKSLGHDGDQFGTSVATDKDGNVFISGYMSGGSSIDFGGGLVYAVGNFDAIVAKLDATTGNTVWGKRFGLSGSHYAWHLATTSNGDVVVAGNYNGDIDFGGGAQGYLGQDDAYVLRLGGGDGHLVWTKHFGDSSNQRAFGVAVDSHDNIVLAGHAEGTIGFGGGVLTSSGKYDAFVAHLGPDGAHHWSQIFGDALDDQTANSVAVDPLGNVVLAGSFQGTFTIAGDTIAEAPGSFVATQDAFVARLSVDGKDGWARRFGDPSDQIAWAVTSDTGSNSIVGGTFQATIDFSPPANLTFAVNNSTYDAFWVKLGP